MKTVQRIIMIFAAALLTGIAVAQQPADTLSAEPLPPPVPLDLPADTLSAEPLPEPLYYQYELSLWGGAGLPALNYDLSIGERRIGLNLLGGVGYSVFFDDHWSAGLGLEVSLLKSSAAISRFSDYYPITTSMGQGLPLNLEITGYDYTQRFNLYYLNVPLIVRYQFDLWKHRFYVAGGLKLGFPLSSSYTAEGSYMSRAFARDSNGENMGDPMQGILDFGTYQVDAKGDWDVKMNTVLTLEVGKKWALSGKLALYSGLYMDYGLSDLRKDKAASGGRLIDYVETGQGYDRRSTPLPEAVYAVRANAAAQNFNDRVNSFSVGLKLRLSFGVKPRYGKPAEIQPVIEPVIEREAPPEEETPAPPPVNDIIDSLNTRVKAITALLEEEQKARQGQDDEFGTVYGFDLDKTVILEPMLPILLHNATVLKKHKTMKVILEGHTDEHGSESYNLDLGLRRAQAVKDWLIVNGVNNDRIVIDSKGKSQPLVPNVNEANKRYNRRVVFLVAE